MALQWNETSRIGELVYSCSQLYIPTHHAGHDSSTPGISQRLSSPQLSIAAWSFVEIISRHLHQPGHSGTPVLEISISSAGEDRELLCVYSRYNHVTGAHQQQMASSLSKLPRYICRSTRLKDHNSLFRGYQQWRQNPSFLHEQEAIIGAIKSPRFSLRLVFGGQSRHIFPSLSATR